VYEVIHLSVGWGRKADMDLGESISFRSEVVEVVGYLVFSIVCVRSTEGEEPHL